MKEQKAVPNRKPVVLEEIHHENAVLAVLTICYKWFLIAFAYWLDVMCEHLQFCC